MSSTNLKSTESLEDTMTHSMDIMISSRRENPQKRSQFGLKKLNIEDSDSECSTQLNSPKDWSSLANSLAVSDEKDFKIQGDFLDVFENGVIKKNKENSLWNSSQKEKRRRASECLVTWPQYKRLMKKTERDRMSLHGLSAKNYLKTKYSVFEHREKFSGEDKVDEFE